MSAILSSSNEKAQPVASAKKRAPEPQFAHSSLSVTPDMAKEWLRSKLYSRQRKIRSRTVQRYARDIFKGAFLPVTTLTFAIFDGEELLVDGQHRLQAVVEAKKAQVFQILRVHVSMLDEVDELYAKLDSGSTRSPTDILRAFGVEKATSLTERQAREVRGAAVCIASGFKESYSRVPPTPDETRDSVWAWAKEAVAFYDIVGCNARISKRFYISSVLSVGLVCVRYQPEKARAFFGRAAADDGLRQMEPEKVLNNFLADSRINSSVLARQERKEIVTTPYVAREVAACWNAYMDGKTLRMRPKILDPLAPIRIAGTIYDGK